MIYFKTVKRNYAVLSPFVPQEVFIIPSHWYIFLSVLIVFCIIVSRDRRRKIIIKKNLRMKKKGVKRTMPLELLNDCIGKEVIICVEGELSGFKANVISIKDNWIKVEEKNNIRLINGDMITQIFIPKKK